MDAKKEVKEAMKKVKEKIIPVKKKTEMEKKNEELQEMVNTCKKVQAEFENYKKRIDKEKQDIIEFSNAELIKKMLPIMDNFELAFKNEKQTGEELKKGMELIFAQMKTLLEDEKVKEVKNESFDPTLHEAMMVAKDEKKKENEIIEIFQKGYKKGERVLRHSKVKVNKL